MKKTLFYIAMALAVGSCVYPYEVELGNEVQDALVIDANILLGTKSTVTVSRLQPLNVGSVVPTVGVEKNISTATVYLEDDASARYNATYKDGKYTIPAFPYIPDGGSERQYRLTVELNGKVYRSSWITPEEAPVIKDISFVPTQDEIIVTLDAEDKGSGHGYAAVSVEEIWRFHAEYARMYIFDPDSLTITALFGPDLSRYWCWKKEVSPKQSTVVYSDKDGHINAYPVFSFLRANNRNHDKYELRMKVWNLDEEQYKYRKLLEENGQVGTNLFYPEPGDLVGNLSCETNPSEKVYGYVNVSKVTVKDVQWKSTYKKMGALTPLMEAKPSAYLTMYNNGYYPIDNFINSKGENVLGWGQARCFDCTADGGTLEKPSFE